MVVCLLRTCKCVWVTAVVFPILSVKSVRAPQEVWRKWLRAAVLGTCATLAALLLWGSLGGDDDVTEVLAHRGEVLAGRFIEVPCSEDYDSHRRFEGAQCRGVPGNSSTVTSHTVYLTCMSAAAVNWWDQIQSGGWAGGWPYPSPRSVSPHLGPEVQVFQALHRAGPVVTAQAVASISLWCPALRALSGGGEGLSGGSNRTGKEGIRKLKPEKALALECL